MVPWMRLEVIVDLAREGIVTLHLILVYGVRASIGILAKPFKLSSKRISVKTLQLATLLFVSHAESTVQSIIIREVAALSIGVTLTITVVAAAKLVPKVILSQYHRC